MSQNKYKDVFGELEFSMGNYFVPHKVGGTGKYVILKREPWYVTDAYVVICDTWVEHAPLFDSWIQAIRYLKENFEKLL